MANKISTFIEFETQQAKSALASFKSSIADAHTTGDKFKAGWSSITDSVAQNAGAIATIGGAALIGFGVKAVGAFEDTAKAAINLSDATGLSTEAASRWIGVGDDYQVSAEALTASIGKIGKTLDGTSWEKYGIATRDAGGEARDTNDILVDALARLSSITNETERAKAGNELFGKGYAQLAPLIGHTKDEYEKMLGSVEKGQVITEAEAKKSEKMRLAQDQLSDSIHELTLSVGQEVTSLAPLIVALAKVVDLAAELPSNLAGGGKGFRENADAIHEMRGQIEKAGLNFGDWEEKVLSGEKSMDDLNKAVKEGIAEHTSLLDVLDGGEKSWEETTDASDQLYASYIAQERAAALVKGMTEQNTKATEDATAAAKAHADQVKAEEDQIKSLFSTERSAVDAKYAYADAQAKAMQAIDAASQSLKDHSNKQADDDAAVRAANDAILAQSEAYVKVHGATVDSADGIALQIQSLKEQEKALAPDSPLRVFLDQYIADLENIPKNISTIMDLAISSGSATTAAGDVIGKRSGRFASGTSSAPPGVALVGEDGPELVVMRGGEQVIPNSALAGGSGGGGTTINLTVHAGIATDGYRVGQQIVNALAEYERRSGTDWRRTLGRAG